MSRKSKINTGITTTCATVYKCTDGECFLNKQEAQNHEIDLNWEKKAEKFAKDLWVALGLPAKDFHIEYDFEDYCGSKTASELLDPYLYGIFDDCCFDSFDELLGNVKKVFIQNREQVHTIMKVVDKYFK